MAHASELIAYLYSRNKNKERICRGVNFNSAGLYVLPALIKFSRILACLKCNCGIHRFRGTSVCLVFPYPFHGPPSQFASRNNFFNSPPFVQKKQQSLNLHSVEINVIQIKFSFLSTEQWDVVTIKQPLIPGTSG